MGKQQLALWIAAAGAFLGGCAPVQPYLAAMYTYAPPANPGNYYGARPILASYNRPAYNNYQPAFQNPFYSRHMEPADAPARRALLSQANQALGTRYRIGGETPREGFDCSGLTQYVYKHANGITLPRTAAQQSAASRTISFNQMRPGDLIFFHTSGRQVNHVGIYIGRGQFIHAASGGGRVTVDNLGRPYWQQRLAKFGTFMT
jgi:cell wall-associated NlpC family hydrolase